MTYPRAKIFERVDTILVVPATVSKLKQFRKRADDPRNLALELIDWFDRALWDV